MNRSEKFGIVFWVTAVVLLGVITACIMFSQTLEIDAMLKSMKDGNEFYLYDLYDSHDWNYVVILNGTVDRYETGKLTDKYQELYSRNDILNPEYGVIVFVNAGYTRDIDEVLRNGDIVNIAIYDMNERDEMIFTQNAFAGPHEEAFFLERWETSFRILTVDGRRYAENISKR